MRPIQHWPENAGTTMNTKGELPELPANSSPLQFGDWLHLIAPSMKDISSVAGWWWENTLREAQCYYAQWKESSPLQRIRIQPTLPDAIKEHQFQRTEQRGIQMLLKAIPETEQQALVTERVLSTTAIIYRLLIRFQPGGAGEKQILLQQLTTMPKSANVQELASNLRNWRRHFGRAQEVEAVLPDGILLLKALDQPLQQLGTLDPQAAFRLSQSRMQLQLDQQPSHNNLWAFSQCLLAEAETLSLLQTSPMTSTSSTPIKIKQLEGEAKTPGKSSPGDNKSKFSPMSDKPCRFFQSDAGCKAGKSCKWLHTWASDSDKASRCFVCGSKEHRKVDCPVKANGKKPGEPSGSGGGNGQGRGGPTFSTSTSGSNVGGKAGAAAAKVINAAGEESRTTTAGDGKGGGSTTEPTSSTTTAMADEGKSSGGSGGEPAIAKNDKASELLHEATQLLKTLRVSPGNPRLKVMQIGELDRVEDNMVLIDSGATHSLRPARDDDEWQNAQRTRVQLANGSTDAFRLKKGTKILLGHPVDSTARIVPMSGLSDLDFSLEWREGQCRLQDDEGRQVPVTLQNGCPMIDRDEGEKILQWLELYQVYQHRKLAVVKTMMMDDSMVDKSNLSLDLAMTLKMRQEFPELPDHIMMKLIPHLDVVQTEGFGAKLPWNRHKRRRLDKAKNIILHLFSGPDKKYWDKQCSSGTTEVLCVDTSGLTPANLHDRNVFGYLLSLCAAGKVKAILAGPPCRTVSALRYQNDGGPGILRTDQHPYGLPDLSVADAELVEGDVILWFRMLALYVLAEDVRPPEEPQTQLAIEQPEDPARYRKLEDVEEHKYMSAFRTKEWRDFQDHYKIRMVHCDQHPMGHTKKKPTTLATTLDELRQLDGLRGDPDDAQQAAQEFKNLPMEQRCQVSKTWASWAPGLKLAIATAVNHFIQKLDNDQHSPRQAALRPLTQVALEAWKNHFLHDHLPARRDCMHCVRAQARSKPHRKVTHPEAYTLSVDLSGRMTAGQDQEHQRCKYLMVACYTFPVTGDGRPLVQPPGAPPEDHDHPLPSMDLHGGEDQAGHPLPSMDLYGGDAAANPHGVPDDDDEVLMDEEGDQPPTPEDAKDLPEPEDPLHEEAPLPHAGDGPAEQAMRGADEVWHRLVQDATNVGVMNLTFVELLGSRSVAEVLPALARIYARLRALGLPLLRLHCDRARELVAAPVRRWTLDRGIVTTLTSGSSYKSNGRVESEVGATKRAIKTLISAGLCPAELWPLAARHIGERRLRNQLKNVGWPASPMLRFGSKAFALRKSWQERYTDWRDAREEVVVMGPDKFSSLTTTSYYVKSLSTGKFFYTDDVVQPPGDVPLDLQPEPPAIYLEERGDRASPPQWNGVPTRRLRGKTAVPAISMVSIEGEDKDKGQGQNDFGGSSSQVGVGLDFGYKVPEWLRPHFELEDVTGSDEESWPMKTDSEKTSASSSEQTPSMQSDLEDYGGGEKEEAPNDRAGGAHPVASGMDGLAALRCLHGNIGAYIEDEYTKLDATSDEQSMWIGTLTDAIKMKAMIEHQLQEAHEVECQHANKELEKEFLITKTISNAEVWSHLDDWENSIRAEFEQLVNTKQAVRQVSKAELRRLAKSDGLPIELLPGKMVHTRKAGSGAYRSRAVVCGNYQEAGSDERYAGGADGNQIRAQVRLAGLKSWSVCGTDIRVAFLNAPKRDDTKITAMEVPTVFRKLGLAGPDDVWIIQKAVYGLTSSPRDWCLYRDETLPTMSWRRNRQGQEVDGSFIRTPDDNVWRLEEVDRKTGEKFWAGLMSVYVDDLLVTAEDSAAKAAIQAIADVWAISDVETADVQRPVKYCGFEIEAAEDQNGYILTQKGYEQEMLKRWNVTKSISYPNFKLGEGDEDPADPIDQSQVKTAQAIAGALLWLNTRTRPDISVGVSAVCRLATKNPAKSIEIGMTVMAYIHGNPGGLHYPKGVPEEVWGDKHQLKIARNVKLLEVFSDIAYGTGSRGRSVQGIAIFFGGCIISWQTTVQPFVTHSTAESELVAYCDALNAGRSAEAMLAMMMGVPSGSGQIERVLYGDNVAAISLAHGTSNSSWRTRHLRIRASYLREALEGRAPGGLWRLLHLRGTELVADGMTKPLLGQAFYAFLVGLGMQRQGLHVEEGPQDTGVSNAAVVAMMTGSLLLSGVDAEENGEGGAESEIVWICGAVLMVLGAVQLGQFAFSCAKGCLKRLSGPSHRNEEGSRQASIESDSGSETSVLVKRGKGTSSSGSSMSLSIRTQSGSQHGSCAAAARRSSISGSRAVAAGRSSAAGSCDAAAERSSTVGSRDAAVESTAAGRSSAAEHGSSAAEHSTCTEASEGGIIAENIPANPWNRFQRDHKGLGLSKQTMSKIYQYEKRRDKMP